jgi:glucan phosphoethanolaminetransferase (alkaline phosphatase superfamily)
MFALFLSVGSVVLPVLLLARATQRGILQRLPFFYSYVAFVLLETLANLTLLSLLPQDRAIVFWFGFVLWQIVEFAVLIEISDQIFKPFPPIRVLGRVLCAVVGMFFAMIYIFPAFEQNTSSASLFLDLAKRALLTKAVLVLVLLAAARYYKLTMSRGTRGILLGFMVYLAMNIANFELAQTFGRGFYAPIFQYVGPLAWILGATVWAAALWNEAPATLPPGPGGKRSRTPLAAGAELERYNDALTKLLQK